MYPPLLPWKKKKKLWYLIRVPDVCMYLFIWIFIVFSVKQFASLGAFQKFKKTYMAKPQRSKTCVLWTLCSTLGCSLKWFMLKQLSKSSYCPERVLRSVLDGDRRTLWRTLLTWSSSSLLRVGIHLKRSYSTRTSISSLGHLWSLSTFYCWRFCYFYP